MSWLDDAKLSINDEEDSGKKPAEPENKKSKTELPEGFSVNAEHIKTTGDLISEFATILYDFGFQLENGVEETNGADPIRCDIDGSKAGTKVGWYYFKRVGKAAFGTYGDWRTGGHHNWAGFLNGTPSKSEITKINKKLSEQAEAAKKEKEKLTNAATKYVRSKILALPKLTKHVYFSNKKISHIIPQVEIFQMGKKSIGHEDFHAVIPIYDLKGQTVNWQRINGEGQKRFKKYAIKKGNFHVIGDLKSSKSVVFCEGFATGSSIYLALNCAVIVCFDSGNLMPVMDATQKLISGKNVFIAADNDLPNKTNGKMAGIEAAEKCRDKYPAASIAIPDAADTDFNDLWCAYNGNAEAVEKILARFVMAGFQLPEKQNIKIWDGEELLSNTPKLLMQAPSKKIQALAEWMESTAVKSSRQVALMGAITFACGISGRLYMENEMGNYSSILGCVIAPTGGGKDFIKKCINKILIKSPKTENVIGSSSYTSEAAIRNQLIQHPVKISVLDEFGDKLQRGLKGAGRDVESFDALKEIYSDCRGVWAGRAYAMLDGSGGKQDLRAEAIYNPALTVLGLSTPRQFVDAITDSHVEGGFLNRFIIMDARNDRVVRRRKIEMNMPDWIVDHCERVVTKGDGARFGNLHDFSDTTYSQEANPKPIPMSNDVSDLFWDFSNYLDEEYASDSFMENLSSRWAENSRRLCVGMSAFENPESPKITIELAQWCISFVQYHGKRLAALIDRYSCHDDYHRLRNSCLEAIRNKMDKGMSRSQMGVEKPFRGLQLTIRNKILNELEELGLIGINIKGVEGSGKVVYYGIKV